MRRVSPSCPTPALPSSPVPRGVGVHTPALIPLGLKPSLISPPVPWSGASSAPLPWGPWSTQLMSRGASVPLPWGFPQRGHIVPTCDRAGAVGPPLLHDRVSMPCSGWGDTFVLQGALGCKGGALAQGPSPWGLASPPCPTAPQQCPPNFPKAEQTPCLCPGPGLSLGPSTGVPQGRTCRLMHFSLFVLSLPLGAAPTPWGLGARGGHGGMGLQGSPFLPGPQYPPAKLLHGSLLSGGCACEGCSGVLWGAGLGCCPPPSIFVFFVNRYLYQIAFSKGSVSH